MEALFAQLSDKMINSGALGAIVIFLVIALKRIFTKQQQDTDKLLNEALKVQHEYISNLSALSASLNLTIKKANSTIKRQMSILKTLTDCTINKDTGNLSDEVNKAKHSNNKSFLNTDKLN